MNRPTSRGRRAIFAAVEVLESRRLLSAGDLDPLFGGDGIVQLPTNIDALTRQGNKVIVAANLGSRGLTSDPGVLVFRLNTDGTVDSTFGTTSPQDQVWQFPNISGTRIYGKTSSGAPAFAGVRDITMAPDGKIIVFGGNSDELGNGDWYVARLNPNGGLDTTFDGDGIATFNLGFADDNPVAVLAQSDGKIIGAGAPASRSFSLVRWNPDGSIDKTFDGDGRATYYFDNPGSLTSIALTLDNKIVAGGMVRPTSSSPAQRTLVRWNLTNGSKDPTFDGDGVKTGLGAEPLRDIKVQSDSKILTLADSTSSILVNRYLTSGTNDTTFGSNGQASVANDNLTMKQLALQQDGKILLSGSAKAEQTERVQVLRLYPNGSIDNGFGTAGRINQGVDILGSGFGGRMAVTADNKLLVRLDSIYLGRYLLDGDTGGGEGTNANISVSPAGVLTVRGTDLGDTISVAPVLGSPIGVHLNQTFVTISAVVTAIVVDAGGGGDNVSISPSLAIPSSLLGGDGNDSLTGGSGNDTLDGQAGTDTLDGAAGSDTAPDPTGDVLLNIENSGGGVTAPYLITADGTLIVTGTAGSDALQVFGNDPSISIILNGQRFDILNAETKVKKIQVNSGDGNDNISVNVVYNTTARPTTIAGGAGNDTILGGWSPELLLGQDGNDSLAGGDGNDTLDGGAGGDTMKGGNGNDTLDYSSRTNAVSVGPGTLSDDGQANERDNIGIDIETVLGGSGNDTIKGTAADNLLVGNAGNDSILGFDGNDTLFGNDGNDTLDGGNGIDVLQGGTGDNVLLNGETGDTLPYTITPDRTLLVTGTVVNDQILIRGGQFAGDVYHIVHITVNSGPEVGFDTTRFDRIRVLALDGNDQIEFRYLNNFTSASAEGGAGDDTLIGSDGNDLLVGGAGNDTLNGGRGGDSLQGGDGNDTVDYSSRTANLTIGIGTLADDGEANEHDNVYLDIETVLGGSGNDVIHGGAANNLIVGNGGNDQLFGNYGDDTLSGNGGADTLNGEGGIDTAANAAGDLLVSIEKTA